jgi:hypothetical protein
MPRVRKRTVFLVVSKNEERIRAMKESKGKTIHTMVKKEMQKTINIRDMCER